MPLPATKTHPAEEAYWSLPEGVRAEFVDSTVYDMTPPSRVHQKLSNGISFAFNSYIVANGGSCEVYAAPFAVNLRGDGSAWLEPDVSVVCDPGKLSDRGCEGAPDLVVEITSPSSQRRDYIVKAAWYECAGVREYWIVNPDLRQVTVHRFEDEAAAPRTYEFDEAVPVGIWEGCSVTLGTLV